MDPRGCPVTHILSAQPTFREKQSGNNQWGQPRESSFRQQKNFRDCLDLKIWQFSLGVKRPIVKETILVQGINFMAISLPSRTRQCTLWLGLCILDGYWCFIQGPLLSESQSNELKTGDNTATAGFVSDSRQGELWSLDPSSRWAKKYRWRPVWLSGARGY